MNDIQLMGAFKDMIFKTANESAFKKANSLLTITRSKIRQSEKSLYTMQGNYCSKMLVLAWLREQGTYECCSQLGESTTWDEFIKCCKSLSIEGVLSTIKNGVFTDVSLKTLKKNNWVLNEKQLSKNSVFVLSSGTIALIYAWVTCLSFGLQACSSVFMPFINNLIADSIDDFDFDLKLLKSYAEDSDNLNKDIKITKRREDALDNIGYFAYGALNSFTITGTTVANLKGFAYACVVSGKASKLVDIILKTLIYMPACISAVEKRLFNKELLTKRRETYLRFGLCDTSMFALSRGLSVLKELCNTYFNRDNAVDLVSGTFEEDAYWLDVKNSPQGKDIFCDPLEWFISKSDKGCYTQYVFARVLPLKQEWGTQLVTFNYGMLDTLISANLGNDVLLDALIPAPDTQEFADYAERTNFKSEMIKNLISTGKSEEVAESIVEKLPAVNPKFYDSPAYNCVEIYEATIDGMTLPHDRMSSSLTLSVFISRVLAKRFSNEVAKTKDIPSLNANLARVTKKLGMSESRCNRLRDEVIEYKKEVSNIKANVAKQISKEVQSYTDELHKLKSEMSAMDSATETLSDTLMKKTQQCSALMKQVKQLEARVLSLEAVKPVDFNEDAVDEGIPDVSIKEKVAFLNKFKLVIIGGQISLENDLRKLGITNFKFIPHLGDRRPNLHYDYMIICTTRCDHKLFYWSQAVDKSGDKTIYFNSSGAKAFIRDIYLELN